MSFDKSFWSLSFTSHSTRVGVVLSIRVGINVVMSSLVNHFFLATYGEAWMLAERYLFSCWVEFSASVFINKLCAGAANSTSLFILGMRSKVFQCKWHLF